MKISLFISLLAASLCSIAQPPAAKPQPPLSYRNGKLQYVPDSLGNRIPDFSYCGYKGGDLPIPDATTGVVIPLMGQEDATRKIQDAINYVGTLPPDKNGIRGAVVLQAGQYKINGTLIIETSGVVIRGAGFGDKGTTIVGDGKDRSTLIRIQGKGQPKYSWITKVTDSYVPVNANTLQVEKTNELKVGDVINIIRPASKEWIAELGTDHFGGGITALGWKPDQRNINWIRKITAINGNSISLDAPLTTALDKRYGTAYIMRLAGGSRISGCGIENLQLVSAYDKSNPKDEEHRWMAITIDNASDCWVRQVRFKHFAGSAVAIYDNGSRITVEDCISQQPISEIGGERRNTFFTSGQQTLFQRCYAEYGMHDFATGFCAPGPNAFVQCESIAPYSYSGGIDSWSSGVLFDVVNVDGQAISFMNLGQDRQGAGWNIANSVLWNCTAARIDCYQPPTAQNWAFGSWSQFAGDGYWGESNNSIDPRSLYYAQLKERLGADAVKDRAYVMEIETNATSSPTVEQAAELTKIAYKPAKTVLGYINEASKRSPFNKISNLLTIPPIQSELGTIRPDISLKIKNGWLVSEPGVLTGSRSGVPWWNGNAKPYATVNARPAITRFVPGRIGTGFTDDLDELTDSMVAKHQVGIEQNYGLWYDRRRDDHERIRRADGDVWAPFYELPFARSGKELAWDGLSKYDLTKYNHWYWSRLKQFADLADKKGLVLIYHNYFQHNIIEAGAHYADFPWRTANNINNTGFPEPVPYAGDKRIFMAEQFYDTTDANRRRLHRAFIFQCLDNFKDNNGVIQQISEEYTGPLHFVQFWLNTIRDWERINKKSQFIGLSTTKDVQDAILNDPKYASLIDVIDIRYWHYQADGSLYAPKGGQSLAPRQHARLLKPKSTSPEQVYRAVLEYKTRFPDKAVIYSGDGADKNGWAVFMAGGSLPDINVKDYTFLMAASFMKPVVEKTNNVNQWELYSPREGYIIYNMKSNTISVPLENDNNNYEVTWISISGQESVKDQIIKGGKTVELKKPANGSWVLWLKKK